MRKQGDLEAAVGGAALCALLALFLPFDSLRILVGAPLLFFLPGYAIAAAIFARGRIGRGHFLVFSVGLSLAVLALGALVLNYLPGGIRSGWWAVLLFLVVLGACRGAALRRPRRAGAPIALSPLPRVNGAQAGLLAGGGLLAVAAIVLAFVPLSATNAIGYTEVWIQPLEASAGPGVRIGVGSGERDDSSYRLVVEFGDGEGEATQQLELAPGQKQVLELQPPDASPAATPGAGPIPVVATLYKEDSPKPDAPFRQVSTYIDGAGGPG